MTPPLHAGGPASNSTASSSSSSSSISSSFAPSPALSSGKKVLFGKYELGRLLGCGAFAKVYHARETTTSQKSVAIKVVSKHRVLRSGLAPNIKREISIMRRLRHPNIVRLHEVLASRDRIYFVMDLVKGGELFARIASRGRLPEDLARRYFHQLVSAVGYCHSRGVFHRDLKPENLLLDESGDLRVTDFGLSAVAADQNRQDGMLHTLCGTPAYVAPEILAKKGYDGAKVDIWSCGVILFVLVAGYLPFNDPNLMAMYRKIYRGDYRCPKWVSPGLRRLLARLLDTNPATRVTVDGILNDGWFRSGADEGRLAALAKFHHDDDEKESKAAAVEREERELNAFDIISFSTGFDLSGLFEPAASRERFVAHGTAEAVLGKLEKVGREEGLEVRRKGSMGLVMEGRGGGVVARAEMLRLNGEMLVVEVGWGGNSSGGYDGFWKERLRPVLEGLAACGSTPPMTPVGGGPVDNQEPISVSS